MDALACLKHQFDLVNAQLEALLSSTYDGLYITDGNGMFLKVNEGLERITGLKKEELVGAYTRDLQKQGIINRSVFEIVLEKKERVTIIQYIKGKTTKEVMVTATPILDNKGTIKFVVANLRDMTELKYLQSECEKAKQLSQQYYTELVKEKKTYGKIIAESEAMKKTLELAYRVSQVDSSTLLEGESGVGKEVISHFIHDMSPRSKKPFICINCAALPENLLESELFGYKEGSFTGASKQGKLGLIELAENGTLFLDEINSFPLSLQGKLLRVIENLELTKIGSTVTKKVNFRLITATNKNLKELVEKGLFRDDLYFRLKVIPIKIPPLRERKEDILPLTIHFLNFFNEKYDKRKEFSSDLLQALEGYSWPGNARELRNVIERLVVISPTDLIETKDLPDEFNYNSGRNKKFMIILNDVVPLKELIDEAETILINQAMKKFRTTRAVAKALNISQSSVVRKLNRDTTYL